MDNLSETDMILSKYSFIMNNFHCDTWWYLWSSGLHVFDSQQNGAAHRRWGHILAFIERNATALEVQKVGARVNVTFLTYACDHMSVLWLPTRSGSRVRPAAAMDRARDQVIANVAATCPSFVKNHWLE